MSASASAISQSELLKLQKKASDAISAGNLATLQKVLPTIKEAKALNLPVTNATGASKNKTLISIAANFQNPNPEVLKYLLKEGCDLAASGTKDNKENTWTKVATKHPRIFNAVYSAAKTLKSVKQLKQSLDTLDGYGVTTLISAVRGEIKEDGDGNIEIIAKGRLDTFIAVRGKGADIRKRCSDNCSVLWHAIDVGNGDIAEYLIKDPIVLDELNNYEECKRLNDILEDTLSLVTTKELSIKDKKILEAIQTQILEISEKFKAEALADDLDDESAQNGEPTDSKKEAPSSKAAVDSNATESDNDEQSESKKSEPAAGSNEYVRRHGSLVSVNYESDYETGDEPDDFVPLSSKHKANKNGATASAAAAAATERAATPPALTQPLIPPVAPSPKQNGKKDEKHLSPPSSPSAAQTEMSDNPWAAAFDGLGDNAAAAAIKVTDNTEVAKAQADAEAAKAQAELAKAAEVAKAKSDADEAQRLKDEKLYEQIARRAQNLADVEAHKERSVTRKKLSRSSKSGIGSLDESNLEENAIAVAYAAGAEQERAKSKSSKKGKAKLPSDTVDPKPTSKLLSIKRKRKDASRSESDGAVAAELLKVASAKTSPDDEKLNETQPSSAAASAGIAAAIPAADPFSAAKPREGSGFDTSAWVKRNSPPLSTRDLYSPSKKADSSKASKSDGESDEPNAKKAKTSSSTSAMLPQLRGAAGRVPPIVVPPTVPPAADGLSTLAAAAQPTKTPVSSFLGLPKRQPVIRPSHPLLGAPRHIPSFPSTFGGGGGSAHRRPIDAAPTPKVANGLGQRK